MNNFFATSSVYSLKKSTTVLRHAYHLFQRKKKRMPLETREILQKTLQSLEKEILEQNQQRAHELAKQVEALCQMHLRKTSFDHVRDLTVALAFALFIAILVRQMWFEFYEIPSGSMRPTLKEQDRLVVSKTDFCINLPLTTKHLYFDPALVKHNGIVIFTGENMDIKDVDTLYFYIFPGKKQYIKRMIGKPGDLLYFYGGQIYGVDAQGNDITASLQLPRLEDIDHIPFIDFDRKIATPQPASNGIYPTAILYQMNEPVAKLYMNSQNQLYGEMLPQPQTHYPSAPPLTDYSDMWGFKNYAMARLLTRDQVKLLTDQDPSTIGEGVLYLELKHHPSLASIKLGRDEYGRLRPVLGLSTSIIPLQEKHVRKLFKHLYTARFIVQNGFARRYGTTMKTGMAAFLPQLPNVPDGCYEFDNGKAYAVKWQGITQELPPSHPLYQFDPQRVQLLYNVGIEFDLRFVPLMKGQRLTPARYAYFRAHDLYLLGSPILKKNDPVLIQFLQREQQRQTNSSVQLPYHPFTDSGPPLKADGTVDADFIRQYGIMIPPKMYLVLGDNHAMSADSREFGFVPEDNLRGGPDLIFWPPGRRWGIPNQPAYTLFTIPRTVVWVAAALSIGLGTLYWRRRNRLPLHY
jgi:signal peptidase I